MKLLRLDSGELLKIKKTRCIFEGNTYKKGEKIIPDGVCHECICDEKLKSQDLDIFTPQCQRKQCGIGISGPQHDYLNRGCVPVYDKTATTCCPIEWRCRKLFCFQCNLDSKENGKFILFFNFSC